jgi:hypothetical protein
MATKAAEVRIGSVRATTRRTNVLKSIAGALKEWGQKGQLTGYSEIELSRQTGGRV